MVLFHSAIKPQTSVHCDACLSLVLHPVNSKILLALSSKCPLNLITFNHLSSNHPSPSSGHCEAFLTGIPAFIPTPVSPYGMFKMHIRFLHSAHKILQRFPIALRIQFKHLFKAQRTLQKVREKWNKRRNLFLYKLLKKCTDFFSPCVNLICMDIELILDQDTFSLKHPFIRF